MCTFVRRDLIAEKLEIARTLGLVTKYVVRPTDPGEGASSLNVRVWPSPGANEKAIADYLARLLDGLVSSKQIMLTDEVPALPDHTGTRISAAA